MNSWPSVRVGDLVRFQSGGTPKRNVPHYFKGDIPWITGADIDNEGSISPRFFITEEAIKNSATQTVAAGTVLLVTRTSVGKTAVADFDLCFSQDITGLISDDSRILPRYLAHFLNSKSSHMTTHSRGATIKGVTRDVVADLKISLPSLNEQKKVVETLDTVGVLRAKRREAIALLDDLTQSVFLDMFGDPTSKKKGQRQAPLKEVVQKIQTGPFGSLLHRDDYTPGGIPLINPMHITEGRIVPDTEYSVSPEKHADLAVYQLRKGDLIMGRRGEMGRCAIVQSGHEGMLCGTGSLIIRPDKGKVTAIYLKAALSHPSMKRYLEGLSLGSTLPNLNQTLVGRVPIDIPPLKSQKTFEERVSAIDSLKEKHRAHLAHLDELFASLQQRAFRGDLFSSEAA